MSGPLSDLKVVELGTLIAGPYCARLLAEFGAEVIKVETPGEGDPLRKWRKLHEGTSLWWYAQARNKKSVAVNLQRRPRARRSCAGSRAQRRHRGRELPPRHAREVEPRLRARSRATTRGSSWCGSRASARPARTSDRPGFGAIGESMGGMRYVTGYPDRPPVRVGISIGDSLAAMFGVIGALMALHHRAHDAARARSSTSRSTRRCSR